MAGRRNGPGVREEERCEAVPGWARVFVGRSSIHGKGLFAAADIEAGSLIGVYEGDRTARDGRYVLWVEDGHGGVYGVRGRNHLRFLNHSLRPNAEFDGEELYALRRIPRGAEITFHYGDEWGEQPDLDELAPALPAPLEPGDGRRPSGRDRVSELARKRGA